MSVLNRKSQMQFSDTYCAKSWIFPTKPPSPQTVMTFLRLFAYNKFNGHCNHLLERVIRSTSNFWYSLPFRYSLHNRSVVNYHLTSSSLVRALLFILEQLFNLIFIKNVVHKYEIKIIASYLYAYKFKTFTWHIFRESRRERNDRERKRKIERHTLPFFLIILCESRNYVMCMYEKKSFGLFCLFLAFFRLTVFRRHYIEKVKKVHNQPKWERGRYNSRFTQVIYEIFYAMWYIKPKT